MFFVYKIFFKNTGQYYYGGRYNKKSSPDDLGNTYFSSSPVVQKMLFEHGMSNVEFIIINQHTNKDKCRSEEYNLINKYKNDIKCLNKQGTNTFAKKISDHHKIGSYDDRNKRQSTHLKQQWCSPEFRQKRIKSATGRSWKLSPEKAEHKKNLLKKLRKDGKCKYDNTKNTIWINNGTVEKRIPNTSNIPENFKKGRLTSFC